MLSSDFRPEVEIWPLLACTMHNYWNISFIVDFAMGQIPRSTERISSFSRGIDYSVVLFNNQKQNKEEFCIVELHVLTSDVEKSTCDYGCGTSVHVIDLTVSPAKVSCIRYYM